MRTFHVPAVAALLAAIFVAGCGTASEESVVSTRPQTVAERPVTVPSPAKPVRAPRSQAAVPILMYHVIAEPKPTSALPDLWVPPLDFAAQMRALGDAGYKAVTLTNVLDAWRGRAVLPRKPIVVSFDDGYLSQGQEAADVLRSHGWPGVLNLVLHAVGAEGGLTKTRIRKMLADGWELGAHSLTHADMTTLGSAALKNEVAGSRTQLQQMFGVSVATFCYPSGRYNAAAERAVRDAGYRAATTVDPGAARPSDDRFALPRVRVNHGESPEAVLDAVRAAAG